MGQNLTTIIPLEASDKERVGQFLRIYQSSIEPSEQKRTTDVEALVGDPRYRVLVSLDGERVSGFAMCVAASRNQFLLLEYVAVDKGARSSGIGAALVEAVAEIAARSGAPLLLEVDQPGSGGSPGNDPARRLRFYAERGCYRIVGLDYILPLDTNGVPPAMWLLARGRTRALSSAELRDWLTALYVEVYGQSSDDPRIEAMLTANALAQFILEPIDGQHVANRG